MSLRVKWHRPGTVHCPDGARPAFAHIGRAPNEFSLKFISIVRCLNSARKISLLMGRCVELPPVRSDVYLQKNILHLHWYLTYMDQNINTNIYVDWAAKDKNHAIDIFAVLSKCGLPSITVRVSLNLSYFNNLFLGRNDGEFWYKCIHHCTWTFLLYV